MTAHTVPDDVVIGAQASQARYYVPSSVSIAQWALESAWGAHMPANSFNPFGIKAKDGQAYVSAMTWEHIDGHDVRKEQRFAKYTSLAQGFEAHARLLATLSLYKPAMDAWYHDRSLDGGVRLMAQHYATDPAYASKIMSLITANDLVRFDSLPIDRAKLAARATAAGVAPASAPVATTVAPKPPTPPTGSADPVADILGPLASIVTDTVGSALSPAGPLPGASDPSPVADESNIMNALSILAGLFGGVSGKIGVASTVVTELPHLVEGTIANVSELPKVKADIDELVADIKGGKWAETPNDLHALIAEFGVILKNYGVSLPALTTMVDKLPAAPAIAKAA